MPLNLKNIIPKSRISQRTLACTLWHNFPNSAYGIAASEKGRFSSVQEPSPRCELDQTFICHLMRCERGILGWWMLCAKLSRIGSIR
jgi:hypothetical protein